MARTTKVVNKRTTGSKNSNTNNGKGFFGKSFDLKSRKVQFFVVILIVAILGGGYFTLKSFAATTITDTYTVANRRLRSVNLSESFSRNCYGKIVTEQDKNGTQSIGLVCSAGSTASRYSVSAVSEGVKLLSSSTPNYRYCAATKGVAPTLTFQPRYQDLSGATNEVRITNFNSGGFTPVCTNWFSFSSRKNQNISAYLTVSGSQTSQALISVSNITLETQPVNVPTSPAPTGK